MESCGFFFFPQAVPCLRVVSASVACPGNISPRSCDSHALSLDASGRLLSIMLSSAVIFILQRVCSFHLESARPRRAPSAKWPIVSASNPNLIPIIPYELNKSLTWTRPSCFRSLSNVGFVRYCSASSRPPRRPSLSFGFPRTKRAFTC